MNTPTLQQIRDLLANAAVNDRDTLPADIWRSIGYLDKRIEAEETRSIDQGASDRIFAIFTRWLSDHPEASYRTGMRDGRFELTMLVQGGTHIFRGQSVQDAYAQAAQTICLDEEYDL